MKSFNDFYPFYTRYCRTVRHSTLFAIPQLSPIEATYIAFLTLNLKIESENNQFAVEIEKKKYWLWVTDRNWVRATKFSVWGHWVTMVLKMRVLTALHTSTTGYTRKSGIIILLYFVLTSLSLVGRGKKKKKNTRGIGTVLPTYPGGHSHMEVTRMCGHDPQSRGLSVKD